MRLWLKLVFQVLVVVLLFWGCEKSAITINLKNESGFERKDEVVRVSIEELKRNAPSFSPEAFVVKDGKHELPSQTIDSDGDDSLASITFAADFAPGEHKTIMVSDSKTGEKHKDYPKRTQAELSQKFDGKWENKKYLGGEFRNIDFVRVPDEHTDHSSFFRYEGPGWESDKVGYRFYLDWRNAIDIYGKKTSGMVLQNVGQDGFDSYHEMAEWGMDILKVGESLGIGSIGMWHDAKVFRVSETDSMTCAVVANGPVHSQIQTRYFGWQVGGAKYDLTSNLSITTGSRMTRHDLHISGDAGNLCTGLVKHEKAELLLSSADTDGWRYLANYGKQTLADDNLGMAILFRGSDLIEMTEDALSHVVVLKPRAGELSYYFLAAWEKELDGITSKDEFLKYLKSEIAKLNEPIAVSFN